jgi:hypothetical protein
MTTFSGSIDRIFVTWTQQWEVDEYIEYYLRKRRLASVDSARAAVWACIARYPGGTPHTKSDLDFYLDANLGHRRRE